MKNEDLFADFSFNDQKSTDSPKAKRCSGVLFRCEFFSFHACAMENTQWQAECVCIAGGFHMTQSDKAPETPMLSLPERLQAETEGCRGTVNKRVGEDDGVGTTITAAVGLLCPTSLIALFVVPRPSIFRELRAELFRTSRSLALCL